MRSGQLIATNDKFIRKLLKDPNYRVEKDGSVWTRITRTGKVSVDPNNWRSAGTTVGSYCHIKYQRKHLTMGRIIYAKFNGPLEKDLVVFHKNGNILDNSSENLEMGTQSKNNTHQFRDLKRPPVMGNKVLNWTIVLEIRRMKSELRTSHSQLSKLFGISKGHVSEIINHKIWIEGKVYA